MTIPASEIGPLRLAALGLVGPPAPTVAEAVRRLGAAQAQDLPGVITSLALRVAARSRAAVTAAFDAGEIVRSWPMRGTLHVVAAEDLEWMRALGTPRPLAAMAARRGGLGLTDADLDRARDLALDALAPPAAGEAQHGQPGRPGQHGQPGAPALTRAELLAVWETAGLAPGGGRGYHLLVHLAQHGLVCFGPVRDGEPLIVDTRSWIRAPRQLERDEALGEWALRYFRGHGPATVADLARWTGLPAADVRAGVALAREHLESVDVDGVEHLMDPATPDRLAAARDEARGVHLLPGFDEFVLGYRDRTAVLDPAHTGRIVPGGNGVFRPTVVADGRIVGGWKSVGRGAKRRVEVEEFGPLPPGVADAVPDLFAGLPLP